MKNLTTPSQSTEWENNMAEKWGQYTGTFFFLCIPLEIRQRLLKNPRHRWYLMSNHSICRFESLQRLNLPERNLSRKLLWEMIQIQGRKNSWLFGLYQPRMDPQTHPDPQTSLYTALSVYFPSNSSPLRPSPLPTLADPVTYSPSVQSPSERLPPTRQLLRVSLSDRQSPAWQTPGEFLMSANSKIPMLLSLLEIPHKSQVTNALVSLILDWRPWQPFFSLGEGLCDKSILLVPGIGISISLLLLFSQLPTLLELPSCLHISIPFSTFSFSLSSIDYWWALYSGWIVGQWELLGIPHGW